MSNWVCNECGATYIDVSHQEPSVLREELELRKANDKILALESELKEVCDVLIRKCPEMKDWVMMNWKNLYEVQDDEKA